MRNFYAKSIVFRRFICLLGALTLLFCALARGSYAWTSSIQTTTASFLLQEAAGAVRLTKYEQGTENRLANAVYDLYRADGTRLPQRYTTDTQGEILVQQLAPGDYFFREVSTPYGYDFSSQENILSFTIPAGETEEQQLRAENLRRTASLTIRKELDSPLADLQAPFEFQVKIGSDSQSVFSYQIYGPDGEPVGEVQALANGGLLSLCAGQAAVFSDIAVGTAYAIQENVAPGYESRCTGASGTISQQGSTADFVNTELTTPQTEYGTLTITKQLVSSTTSAQENFCNSSSAMISTCETAATAESAKSVPLQEPVAFSFVVELGSSSETEYTYTIDNGEPQTLHSGETLMLQDGQSAVFAELPVGTWYQVTEEFSAGYAVRATGSTGTVTAQGVQALFVNTPDTPAPATTTLQIQKELSGDVPGANSLFDFRVQIGSDPNAQYTYTLDGIEFRTAAYGDILQLAPGETATFTDLPVGTPYAVTELPTAGYTTFSENATGTLTSDGCLARFVNTPPAAVKTGSLTIDKQVTGDSKESAQDFALTVVLGNNPESVYSYTLYNAAGVPEETPRTLKSGETLLLRDGEKAVFDGLPVGLPYSVVEDDYFGDGYLTSTEDSTGTIPEEGVLAHFENRYIGIPPERETMQLCGTKLWEHGAIPVSQRPQQVTLYAQLGEVIVAQQTVTADQNWQYAFELPRHLADGTTPACYTISEKPIAGYETTLSEAVIDADGNRIQDITNNAMETVACYTPSLTKQIAGDTPPTAETFTFTLVPDDPENPMPTESKNATATAQCIGAGQADFGSICFTAEGRYGYTIREVSGQAEGYRYDDTEYHLLVEARMQENGLALTVEISDGSQTCDEICFINTYTATGTPTPNPTPEPTPDSTPAPMQTPKPVQTIQPELGNAEQLPPQVTPSPTASALVVVPQTGDNFALWQTVAALCISVAGLTGLALFRKRH